MVHSGDSESLFFKNPFMESVAGSFSDSNDKKSRRTGQFQKGCKLPLNNHILHYFFSGDGGAAEGSCYFCNETST